MSCHYKSLVALITSTALSFAPFINLSNNASAMSYQTNVGLGFTFNPTLSLSVSGDISIPNLSHGMTANSNPVDITVSTNSFAGYTLKATAGNTTYHDTNLHYGTTDSINGSAYTITPAAAPLASGTWGFQVHNGSAWGNLSYNGTTRTLDWINDAYNGLPVYSSTEQATLKDTNTMPAGGSEVTKFRIAASAKDNQTPGTYENVVTFYAVTKEAPRDIYSLTTMQDFATLANEDKTSVLSSMTEGKQYQLADSRDGKIYWISKLKEKYKDSNNEDVTDYKIWMTQDLALDLTASGLTSEDSDLGYSNGAYPTDTKSWNSSSTYAPTTTQSSISSSTLPANAVASWGLGTYYWNGTVSSGSSGPDYTFFSNYVTPDYIRSSSYDSAVLGSESHYRFGNLYTYNAATAGTGGLTASGSDALDSICPKGWHLPPSSGTGSFDSLKAAASLTASTWTASPYYILRGGYVDGILTQTAKDARYWSSTPYDASTTYALEISGNNNPHTNTFYNRIGASVRCVAR